MSSTLTRQNIWEQIARREKLTYIIISSSNHIAKWICALSLHMPNQGLA